MNSSTTSGLELPVEPINQELFDLYQNFLQTRFEKPTKNPISQHHLITSLENLLDEKGKGTDFLLTMLEKIVINHSVNLQSPMYFGHQVPPTLPLAAMLDLIISGMNQSLAVSKMSPVLSVIERQLIRFLSSKMGYPDTADGTITSGGSTSNLIGLLSARMKFFPERVPDNAVIVCSDQSHYSVIKAAIILGFNKDNIVLLSSNNDYQIDVCRAAEIINNLKYENKIPFFISVNAGSTSTGSFDDIANLGTIAQENNMWLHVDAAHGGSLIFSDKLKHLLAGIEKADSISWDGHKMMFMPSSAGICLFKNAHYLKNCFKDAHAPYLYNSKDDRFDLSKLSIQCTRRGDALKLWGSILAYGTDFFAERLEHLADVTQYFYKKLEMHPFMEPLNKPEFNILCFRYKPKNKNLPEGELNNFNAQIRDMINETGESMITMTVLHGKVALRTTIINPATNYSHIDKLIEISEGFFASV